MKTIRALIAASVMLFAGQAQAANFTLDPALLGNAQADFNALSDDLGAAIWMNSSNSAEAHSAGFIPVGVQVAVEAALLKIDPAAPHWSKMGLDLPSSLPFPRARLSVGIPFGLDLGYMVLQMPNSNVEMTGFEGRMAFGSFIPLPFVEANVRIHQSSLTGVTDMEIKNTGFAAMIGADLPIVKPYLEVGTVTSTSTPSGTLAAVGLTTYETTKSTTTVGAKVELALFVINYEHSQVGDKELDTVKLGFEF